MDNTQRFIDNLTDRELAVLIFLEMGFSQRKIARLMGFSRTRAFQIIENIRRKARKFLI